MPWTLRHLAWLAALATAGLIGLFPSAAPAQDVTWVGGGAFGAYAKLFPARAQLDPTPTVSLPAGGADPGIGASADGVSFDPDSGFVITGPLRAETFGRLGALGYTSSLATVDDVRVFVDVVDVPSLQSACEADPTNGVQGFSKFEQPAFVWFGTVIPDSPAPNTVVTPTGPIAPGGITGRIILNEQLVDADGRGITVNAIHAFFETNGRGSLGEAIIGQSRCSFSTKPAAGVLQGRGRKCRAGFLPHSRFPHGQPCGPGPGRD